jgi:hypothetical protein
MLLSVLNIDADPKPIKPVAMGLTPLDFANQEGWDAYYSY